MTDEETLLPREREEVRRLYEDRGPSEGFEGRIVDRLRAKDVLRNSGAQTNRWIRTLLNVAAALVLFGLGTRMNGGNSTDSELDAEPGFVLLLHDAPNSPALDSPAELEHVEAYTRWASEAERRTGDVSGQRLSDQVEWLEPRQPGGSTPVARPGVVGFFTVHAANWEEAVRIAEDHPHRTAGGWLEVRRIAPVD